MPYGQQMAEELVLDHNGSAMRVVPHQGKIPSLVRKLRQNAPELDIQLLELVSVQQIPTRKEGRIDIGFGRLRQSDPNIVGIVLREDSVTVPSVRARPSIFAIARS